MELKKRKDSNFNASAAPTSANTNTNTGADKDLNNLLNRYIRFGGFDDDRIFKKEQVDEMVESLTLEGLRKEVKTKEEELVKEEKSEETKTYPYIKDHKIFNDYISDIYICYNKYINIKITKVRRTYILSNIHEIYNRAISYNVDIFEVFTFIIENLKYLLISIANINNILIEVNTKNEDMVNFLFKKSDSASSNYKTGFSEYITFFINLK